METVKIVIVIVDSGPLVSFSSQARTVWNGGNKDQKINLVVDRPASKIDTNWTSAIDDQKAENISVKQKTRFG